MEGELRLVSRIRGPLCADCERIQPFTCVGKMFGKAEVGGVRYRGFLVLGEVFSAENARKGRVSCHFEAPPAPGRSSFVSSASGFVLSLVPEAFSVPLGIQP
jgi:hypothetical protein